MIFFGTKSEESKKHCKGETKKFFQTKSKVGGGGTRHGNTNPIPMKVIRKRTKFLCRILPDEPICVVDVDSQWINGCYHRVNSDVESSENREEIQKTKAFPRDNRSPETCGKPETLPPVNQERIVNVLLNKRVVSFKVQVWKEQDNIENERQLGRGHARDYNVHPPSSFFILTPRWLEPFWTHRLLGFSCAWKETIKFTHWHHELLLSDWTACIRNEKTKI